MSRRIGWWALAAAVVGAVAWVLLGHGGFLGEADRTWARIQRDGLLRVGMDASYPPFEVVDDAGVFSGYDVDLARALGERWGVQVQFVNVHFDGLYDALRADKFDLIISALPYDRTLTRDLRYSQSYLNAGQVLLVRADDPAEEIADLGDGRLAVELGAEGHQLARRLARDRALEIEIAPGREPADVLALMADPATGGVLCDRVQAYTYLAEAQAHGAPWRVAGSPLTDEPYVIAASIDAPDLISAVDQALTAWRADGTLEALSARWLE
ncbi:MAG: amino acid ABC transporter substrate-binding protein [Chloroflexi bacterium]|nr:amino acid ABC transporter substrate-binding protein [Chloroflexota bacterium]